MGGWEGCPCLMLWSLVSTSFLRAARAMEVGRVGGKEGGRGGGSVTDLVDFELLGARYDSHLLPSLPPSLPPLQVLYLLGLPTPTSLESRTDSPLFLPPSLYGGERHLPRKLVAMAAGWGGKSQVGREKGREGGMGLEQCLCEHQNSPLSLSSSFFFQTGTGPLRLPRSLPPFLPPFLRWRLQNGGHPLPFLLPVLHPSLPPSLPPHLGAESRAFGPAGEQRHFPGDPRRGCQGR